MSIKNNDELIAQAICEYEKGIVKILLLCVDNLEFGLGINKLVQILKGGQTRFITDFSLQNNIGFSLLKQFSKKDIEYGKTPVAFKYPWPSPLYTTSFVFTFAFESL